MTEVPLPRGGGAQRLVLGSAGIWERVTTISMQFREGAESRVMQ